MKKGIIFLFPESSLLSCVLLCCVLLFASCERNAGSVDNGVWFDSIQINETHYLLNDTTKHSCNVQITFVFPDSAEAQLLKSLQTLFTEKTFGDSLFDMEPRQVVAEFTKLYMGEFQRFELTDAEIYPDEEEGEDVYKDETGFAGYLRLKNQLVYNQNNFIAFTVESVTYQGGAHSSKNINGYVYDLKRGKLLQEEDFAGINYRQNLSVVLAKKIAEANGLKNPNDLENLGYYNIKEINPNNNFTIDEKGITYYFNENEIAGTMVGLPRVFIPYEEITVYMKTENPLSLFSH